jgi:zinc transport system permease protein
MGQAYLVSLLCAALLGLVGVVAVARRQVFIAAAVSQASTLGYAVATIFIGAAAQSMMDGYMRDAVTVISAMAAAFITMIVGGAGQDGKRTDGDEMTAWVFIMSSACGVLLLTSSPNGLEMFRRVQVSTVIGSETSDVATFAVLLFGAVVLLAFYARELVLLLSDPVMAAAVGMRVTAWNIALALGLGLVVGLSVKSAGMLFTFGCMAFPAMIGKQWCGQIKSLFWVSPLVAVVTAFFGLWVAYNFKSPPGLVIVAMLGGLALVAYVMRLGLDRVSTR